MTPGRLRRAAATFVVTGGLAVGIGLATGVTPAQAATPVAAPVAAAAAVAAPTPGTGFAPIAPIAPISPGSAPGAAPGSAPTAVTSPTPPTPPTNPTSSGPSLNVDLNGVDGKPSQSIVIILALTVLAVAPSLLILTTSFTKIIVVLSLARNALGLQNVPPNQVLAGLALFLSLFVMGPTLSAVNHDGIQPYLKGEKSQSQAFDDGVKPLRSFMLKQTRKEDLALLVKASGEKKPANADDVSLTTLIPAFVLSELRAAFIIGFVVFVPFLIIDLVVSSSLMSMGMMMLPPTMISLPFKLLLFVMVDGWGLIVHSLISSYH